MLRQRQGFTLIELVLTILLVAILATVSSTMVGTSVDAERYEATRQKMDAMRTAILGDTSLDAQGRRARFGYAGDFGGLPASLSNLTTSTSPAWAFNTAEYVGAGWRGPYVLEADAGAEGITKDKWGNDFVWSPSATPPTLTSYGSDNAAGGGVYAKDITMTFPTHVRVATVHGFVMENAGADRATGKTVVLRYPAAGSVTSTSTTSDSDGYFTFSSIPFGYAALRVTGTPSLGPVPIIVDFPVVYLQTNTLSFGEPTGKVTFNAGSLTTSGSLSNNVVNVTLTNTYPTAKTLSAITVYWDRPATATEGYLQTVTLAGTAQSTGGVLKTTRVAMTSTLTIPLGATTTTFSLAFSANSNNTGNLDMRNTPINCVMEWSGATVFDYISF